MGTKNEPGKFDCYANAESDEPMFVLLGRDPAAGATVRQWVALRLKAGDTGGPKLAEALRCAQSMDEWARIKGKEPVR